MNAAERAEQQMKEKKKKELMQKMQEEKARSRTGTEREEVPSEGVPGSTPHMRKPGEGQDLDVHVRQHRRHHPKRVGKA